MENPIRHKLVVNAPRDAIWKVLASLDTIQDYDEAVVKSYYITENRSGIGASRKCELPDNEFICERVIRWDEGRSYTIEVFEDNSEWPCENQLASFYLTEQGTQQTVVTMEYQYRIKADVPFSAQEIRQMSEELVSGVLDGLKQFVESDQVHPAGY